MNFIITILLWLNTLLWLSVGLTPLAILGLVLQIIWLLILIKEGF